MAKKPIVDTEPKEILDRSHQLDLEHIFDGRSFDEAIARLTQVKESYDQEVSERGIRLQLQVDSYYEGTRVEINVYRMETKKETQKRVDAERRVLERFEQEMEKKRQGVPKMTEAQELKLYKRLKKKFEGKDE